MQRYLRILLFTTLLLTSQSHCILVGALRYGPQWEGHPYDRPERTNEERLRRRASSVEEYRDARIYYFNEGWSWNFTGIWLFIPIGLPYPSRDREAIIVMDGWQISHLEKSDYTSSSVFFGLRCNFLPVPMVMHGCEWGLFENGSHKTHPHEVIHEYKKKE